MRRKLLRRLGWLPPKPRPAPQGALIVTLPKSGSIFLARSLAASCGLPVVRVSPGYFPRDFLDDSILSTLSGIGQAHIPPDSINLDILAHYEVPWLLHVRDPRGALLSWVHHVERMTSKEEWGALLKSRPAIYRDYAALSFDERRAWQISNFYPSMLSWLMQWADIVDSRPELRVTYYRDLVTNDAAFVEAAADTLGLTTCALRLPDRTYEASHFRSGSAEEWRSAFTEEEQNRLRLPQRLCDVFGWSAC